MKKNFLFMGLAVASWMCCTVVMGKVKSIEESVSAHCVKNVGGFVGERMRLNCDIYLKQFPIDRYADYVIRHEQTEWGWEKAEQHGKWMESACLSAVQRDDEELKKRVLEVMHKIIASQETDGYMGATAGHYRSPERPIRGMDPYELYFVFHACMTMYEELGSSEALVASERLADYFLRYFGPGKLEFWPSPTLRSPENRFCRLKGHSDFAGHSAHYSWEGTLLCDPVLRLYEVTGKKKYLDWSKWVIKNIDKWSGWDAFSRLDSVADGTLGVDKLQPYVHSHTFHMNFMGFLRLYRITGDVSLLRTTLCTHLVPSLCSNNRIGHRSESEICRVQLSL